jgi:hypothetical protein
VCAPEAEVVVIGWFAAAVAVAGAPDGTEVSRSRGPREGVVVLYPRLVPETDDPVMRSLAASIQEQVTVSVRDAVGPTAKVDVRPAPERVCPKEGCRAASVGLVLGHDGGGCAVVAVIGPAGPVEQALVPLVGDVDLAEGSLAFRAAPEERMVVRELVPCSEVPARLDHAALEAALTDR